MIFDRLWIAFGVAAALISLSGCGAKSADLANLSASLPSTGSTGGGGSATLPTTAIKFLLSGSVNSGTVGTCYGPFTVSTADITNTTAAVSTNTTVRLTMSGSGTFYSNNTCTSIITSTSISSGSSAATFYYKGTVPGFTNFYATANGFTQDSYPFTTIAGAPTDIVVSGVTTLANATCSSAFTVTLKDSQGNAAMPSSATTINLTGGGSGVFYSDANCAISITSVSIPIVSTSATFYFKDNAGESLTLTAADGVLVSGTANLVVAAAATATKLAFSLSPAYANAGTCFGPILVQTVDASNGLVAVTANKTVTLSGEGSGHFYLDNACSSLSTTVTIPSGSYQASVYFKDLVAPDNLLFTATNGTLTTATYPFTSTPASATKLTVTGGSTLVTGNCSSAYTVALKDSNNNSVNAAAITTVNLSGGGSGTFYSDSGCSSSITSFDIASGASSGTFYFKDASAESLTLTAASAGLADGTLALSTTAGVATQLVFTAPAATSAGVCSAAFTVTSKDANGNVANVTADKVIALSGASNGTFHSNITCTNAISNVTITNGSSSTTFYYYNTTAETISLVGTASGLAQATGSYTVNPNTFTKFVFSGATSSTTYNCSALITVTTTDFYGNPKAMVADTTVTLTGNGAGTFYSDACVTSAGSVTVANTTSSKNFYFKTNSAGSYTFTATNGAISTNLAFSVTATPPTKVVLTGTTPFTSNACNAVTITLRDGSNNATSSASPITVSLPAVGKGNFYTDNTCGTLATSTSIPANTSSVVVGFKDVAGESLTLTATSTGLTSGTLAITHTPVLSTMEPLLSGYTTEGYINGTGTAARFNSPVGIYSDGTSLYVSDGVNYVIRKMNLATQVWSTLSGYPGSAAGTDGNSATARLNAPYQHVMLGGFLYHVDRAGCTVRKVDPSNGSVTTIAGVYGTCASTDGSGSAARFNAPTGLATNGTDLYVAEYGGHCIRKVTTAGVVTTFSGLCGTAGQVDTAVVANVRFRNPYSIVIDGAGTYMYVAEYGNHAIRRITMADGTTTTFAGSAAGAGALVDAVGTAARFNNPVGITTDGTYLYVSDYTNYAIRRVNIATQAVETIVGSTAGHMDGTGAGAKVYNPIGIYSDGSTYVYFVDNTTHTVRRLKTSDNSVVTIGGMSSALYPYKMTAGGGTDGTVNIASTNNASGMVDLNGYLYLTDAAAHTLRRIDLATKTTITLAGIYNTTGTVDGLGTAARFNTPEGLTTDGTNLFIADTNNYCIRKYTVATGQVSVFSGLCGTNGTADGASGTARFKGPRGLVMDSTRTYMYVADQLNYVIRRITVADGTVLTIAGGMGAPAYTDATGTSARFSTLFGLAIASDDSALYVGDQGNNRIRKVRLSDNQVTTFAGSSTTGYVDASAGAARFGTNIRHLTTDGTNIYVADNSNNAIRKIVISTQAVTTFAGSNSTDLFKGELGDGTFNAIPQSIRGLYYSPSGLFFANDSPDYVIRWIH